MSTPKNKKILYIGSSLDASNGGVDRVTCIISAYLDSYGYDCYYIFRPQCRNYVPKEKGYAVDYTKDRHFWEQELRQFIFNKQIDIIINQAQWSPFLIDFLKDLKKEKICKIICCFHVSPDFYTHIQTFLGRLADIPSLICTGHKRVIIPIRNAFYASDKFVLLSNSFKEDFIQRYGVRENKDRVVSIPNPLSFSMQGDSATTSKNQLLMVTRLEDGQKNIKSALRIWSIIEDKHKDWKFFIAGRGPHELMLKKYAQKLKLKRVIFLGHVDNPQKLYLESSIFIMTSRYEGFGMTLTEAQQCGCIPIAFDNFSVVHDIISEGKNGYIIPPQNEEEFAKKISLIISNEQLRINMAKECIASCTKFSINNIGKQWEVLFSEV